MIPQNWKQWLVLALIFILGAATGASLTIGLTPRFNHPPGAQQMKKRLLMTLTHRLNLTPEQQAKVQPILADLATQMQTVHRDEVARATQIMEKATNQIKAILTPEQQAQMQTMQQEMESERDRMTPGRARSRMQPYFPPGGMPPDGMPSPPTPPPGH